MLLPAGDNWLVVRDEDSKVHARHEHVTVFAGNIN
jgi:hypothetical protein